MIGPAARLLDHPSVAAFDQFVDRRLEPWRGHPAADAVFRTASELGDFSVIWHLTGAVRAAFLGRRGVRQALMLSALLGAESLIVNQGVKRVFRRTRPTPSGDERHGLRTPSTSSFPSGHASAAAFAATYLTRHSPRLAPLWWTMAFVVALSRPFTRIHHASDIVGGALVGLALARAAERSIPTA